MRNLKRALSLVLAVVMVIGLMVVGASAVSYNDFSDREEIVNKDAVSMLTTLEIIQGLPDGSYDPTGNVDRAQMAKMISVTLTNNQNCDTLYTNVDSGLTDIAANWARGFINYCYVRGIIAGRGDNTFDPSANVTGVEAAKMLLAALGYNAEIEGLVGPDWALNTAALAQQLGIFRNFTKDVSEPLNRDDAALLIYNALDVELIQEYRNGYAISYDDHRTILSSVFGVMRVEGVVVGNEWAQLEQTDSEAALREGRTTLENVIVYDSTTANTVVDEGVRYDGVVPFNVTTPVDYMGKAVTLYVEKTTVLSNSKVIGVATKDDMNVILTTASTEDTSKDYLKGTGVTVDEDTEYYVNYGYQANEAAAIETINEHANNDLGQTEDYFVANGIEVEVIDNNDDGKAEYVLYTMETLSEVRSYSERNEEFTLYAPGRDPKGKPDNTADSFAVDFEDAVYPNGDTIATDDLVLYVQYGGRTYITLPEIISGTMTRLDRDEDNELYITLDNGEEYRQSFIPDAASKVDVELTHFDIDDKVTREDAPGFDDMFDFILDSNGYVVAIRPTEEPEINYGLVIESAWTQNALTKEGEVKILKADGTTAKYAIDWDASCGDKGDAFATEPALENYLGTRDVNSAGGANYNLNSAVGTVILYSLNEDETELTIDKVLGLHETSNPTGNKNSYINDKGFVTAPDGNKDRDIGNGNSTPAYIDNNYAAKTNCNLQWTLDKDYDKGDASIYLEYGSKDVEYAIDRNTVAFYFDRQPGDDGKLNTSDDVISYSAAIGWNNMGDVDAYGENNKDLDVAVQVYPVEKKTADKTWETTQLAEVVLINAETVVTSRDYMLVLSRNAYTKDDTLWLNVVFEDGTAAEIEIDDKGDFEPDKTEYYMNAYAYVENADGTYDIVKGTRIEDYNGELLLNGTVESDHIYALPDDADVWDVTDMKNAEDDIREGEFSYIECHSVIVPTTVNGRTIRTAYVWEIDDTTETPEQGAKFTNYVDEDNLTGALELYYHGNVPKTNEIKELMSEYLNENIRSARSTGIGNTWMVITEDGDWWDVDLVRVNSVSYNGQTRWVRNGTNDLINHDDVVFSASDDLENGKAVLIQKASTNVAGVRTETLTAASGLTTPTVNYDGDKFTYAATVSADLELADAYSLSAPNISKALEDGTAIMSDSGYVAAGTEVTLATVAGITTKAAGYYRFEVNGTPIGEYEFADGTTHTFSETVVMTENTVVTISDRAALITYNGDEVGYYEDNAPVTFPTTFDSTNTNMAILMNTMVGAASTDVSHVAKVAGYTVDLANDADPATGVISFYDGSIYATNGGSTAAQVTVGGDTLSNAFGYAAVGQDMTVGVSGHTVTGIAVGTSYLTVTDNGDGTVTFEVPAVTTDPIAIYFM